MHSLPHQQHQHILHQYKTQKILLCQKAMSFAVLKGISIYYSSWERACRTLTVLIRSEHGSLCKKGCVYVCAWMYMCMRICILCMHIVTFQFEWNYYCTTVTENRAKQRVMGRKQVFEIFSYMELLDFPEPLSWYTDKTKSLRLNVPRRQVNHEY